MTPRKKRTGTILEADPRRIRAVYYVRNSTDDQDDLLSPEVQTRRSHDIADKNNADMVGGYEDIAISGGSAENRPGFQRMIADAISPEHPFDMIIVYDISRFSRNTRELLDYKHLLKKHGVRIQSVTEPHYGDAASDEAWVHTSAGNEAMLPRTARKTRDSQFEAVKRGYHPGGVPPFGYMTEQVVVQTERHTPTGRPRVKETVHSILVPDPETAPYVVKIFEMNAQGYSCPDISEYLVGQGVKTRNGNDFTPGAVLTILHNRRYTGCQERGKGSKSEYLPEDETEINETAHEAIIPPSVWEKAQEILAARAPVAESPESESPESESPRGKSPRSHSSPYRFTELSECGYCGSSVVLAHSRTLVCSRKKIRTEYCPNSHREKLDKVQDPAVKILVADLDDEDFLNEHFDRVVELNEELVREQKKRLDSVERNIKGIDKKITGLVDGIEDGKKKGRELDEIYDRLDKRRGELREAEKEKKDLTVESEGLMSYVNDRERIIKNAKDARTIIEAEEPQIANKFVKLFVEKLVIKDHVGTIHFTVPPLGEGPYRPPVSFGIGEYLFAQPMGEG